MNNSSALARLEARIGKVLSHPQNRGGFSTALNYTPDHSEQQAHGSLYFVIDIGSPSPLSADIAYNLIDIIKEEYYADIEESVTASFEKALKAANDELAALYKGGEKDWVGKLNLVVAAVKGNKAYIVQRGTAEVHLVRDGQMTNLSRGMYSPGETYRPEETLVNLLEGELEPGDKLLFSTSELFYYISIEKLKRLIENHSPAAGAKKLASLLEQEEAINRTSVLVAEFNFAELIAQETETDPAENWVGEPVERKPAKAALIPEPSLDKAQSLEEVIDREPEVIGQPVTLNYQDDIVAEEELELNEERSSPGSRLRERKFDFQNLKSQINFGDYTSKFKINSQAGQQALSITSKILRSLGIIAGALFGTAAKYTATYIKAIRRRPNGNRILMGMAAGVVVLVLVLGTAISNGYSSNVGGRKAAEALSLAQTKRDEAQAALIYEDTAKARGLLAEAYLSAQLATENGRTQAEANALLAQLQQQLDEVSGVKRFLDIQPMTDFSSLANQLDGENPTVKVGEAVLADGSVYAIDPNNNKVYRYKPASGEMAIVNSLVSTDRKLANSSVVSPTEILFYTTPPNVYRLDLSNNSLSGVALDTGNWNNANGIVAYNGRLYFLDAANNQIWKYQPAPEGYTPVAPYFEVNAGLDLGGVLDFAIDGNVWTLLPNNTIKKYSGGAEVAFNLQPVPQPYAPLGKITQIYAEQDTKLYLLDEDNKRILMYDKEGAYLGQFIYNNIDGAANLTVDEANGFIYLTAGNQLYRIPTK